MKDLTHEQNRKHVRAPISVPIKFTVMSPDMYNNIKASKGVNRLQGLQMENGEHQGPLEYWLTTDWDCFIKILCQEKPAQTLLEPCKEVSRAKF